jgi:hypothetical protein
VNGQGGINSTNTYGNMPTANPVDMKMGPTGKYPAVITGRAYGYSTLTLPSLSPSSSGNRDLWIDPPGRP